MVLISVCNKKLCVIKSCAETERGRWKGRRGKEGGGGLKVIAESGRAC